MIAAWVILWIMFVHWVADFVMQTHEMATQKSTSNYWLTRHVLVYMGIMAFGFAVLWPTPIALAAWVGFNGAAHWVTDYFTSRWSSGYFKANDYHNGFVAVGMDQFIHLTCITLSTWLAFRVYS